MNTNTADLIESFDHPHREETVLQHLYHDQGLTIPGVADRLGVTQGTIHHHMEKNGVERHDPGKALVGQNPWHDRDTLYDHYVTQELTIEEVAEELGGSVATIYKWLKHHEIPRRSSKEAYRRNTPEALKNEEELNRLYWDERMTMQEIADYCGRSLTQAHYWIEKHDIQPRTRGGIPVTTDIEELSTLYWEKGWTLDEIADREDASHASVIRWFDKAGIDRRPAIRHGENHPNWKGGRSGDPRYRNYGPLWLPRREAALERDGWECLRCDKTDDEHRAETGEGLTVHHRIPFHDFVPPIGPIDYDAAHALSNLLTLCVSCHRKIENLPVQPIL